MPCVALTNHKGAPASLGMMSSSRRQKTSTHHLYLTLLMVCFSQVISSCRQVLCLPLEQPPPWCHSHTRAWVPAWDKRAPDLSPGVAGTPWKLQTLIFTFYFFTCVFPLPKVCSHYLLNISVNMPRKAFRRLSANHSHYATECLQGMDTFETNVQVRHSSCYRQLSCALMDCALLWGVCNSASKSNIAVLH